MYRLSDVRWFKSQLINSPNTLLVNYFIADTERRPFAIINEGLARLRITKEQPKDSLPRIALDKRSCLKPKG